MRRSSLLVLCALLLSCVAGCPDGRCFSNADCSAPALCDTSKGLCINGSTDGDCEADAEPEIEEAREIETESGEETDRPELDREEGPSVCPDDMVRSGAFCLDRYEASRPDATDGNQGSDGSRATSRPGVLPWQPVTLAVARAACEAAGKRLCAMPEWVSACTGPDGWTYSYGNAYDASICNGIDAFCDCAAPACAGEPVCPYPHCRAVCGAPFRVMPTGSFPGCVSRDGAFDLNGNVWELADSDDGREHFRGGAYNCGDSEALHRCDHDGSWGPSARGFRCCRAVRK